MNAGNYVLGGQNDAAPTRRTDLVGLAVGVEEGQTIETLVVLREAAEAQEEAADAHLHQRAPLLNGARRQRFRHLDHLGGGLRLLLALGGRGLRRRLQRRTWKFWRCGGDGKWLGTRVRSDLRGLRECHHHTFYNFLDDFFFSQDPKLFPL